MNLRKIFYATICAPLFACALNAQMLTSGATAINILAPKWKMGVSVDASGEYSAPADLSTKIDGDLAVYSASANVKFQGAYADKHFLTLSLNYTYSQYDFSSAAAPFSSANGTSALAFYTARISERWGAFGIASASIGSETGASIWGGRTMLAGAGASYSFCESLTVGIGAMAYSRLDNTWLGLPVGFIDWKITDRLRLRTFSGAALLYDIFGDNSLILNAVAEYRNSYYRLANSSEGRRSVSDSFVQFSVGATYNISKRAYISAAIGGNFNREIALRINSRSSGEYEIDAAPFFSLHAGFSF